MCPNTASLIADELGARNAAAIDLNSACTGFLYGLHVGSNLIKTGAHKKVLVLGGEFISHYMDWSNRDVAVLFGDACGAVVIEAADHEVHAAGQFGFDLTFTGPSSLDPEAVFVEEARAKGANIVIERDPMKAVEGADLVVTDTWVSMHDPVSARERRHNQLRGYQVNEQLMAAAKPDALFMHCLPAHRDDEATSAVMDGPHSVIFDEAENRLHAQKAVMRWCLGL